MPFPPALRYRLVRLRTISRPLRRPAVWGSLATLGLLAVIVPQYLRHPEWRSQYAPAVDSAVVAPDTDLGALSNAELADLAEIDNLALLLNQIQPTTATTLDPPSANAARLAPPAATADQAPTSPFAQYLERNRFRFSPTPGSQPGGTAIAPLGVAADQPRSLSGAIAPESLPPSALQQALNQRLSPASESPRTGSEAGTQTSPEPADGGSEMTPPPWMVEGSLPGVDQRFMRTTPQMSPPPGTTGYTLPPGLVPSPALPSPAPVAPAPAALNLDLDSPVVTPLGSVQGPTQPGAIGNSVSAPPPQPVPPPFSAPRPPGVYTGNGYINTFSDPSGPID